LEYARSQGVRTEVIAFSKTGSSRLFGIADQITDMCEAPEKFLIGKSKFTLLNGFNSPANVNTPAKS